MHRRKVLLCICSCAVATAAAWADDQSDAPEAAGPDVIVGDLYGLTRWGQSANGAIQAYSVGTVSCNVGTQNLLWQSSTNKKPVIGQNMFRLKNGRFEHVGQSWLKWAFSSLNQDYCGDCVNPGSGSLLGVNCSDPYSASLNGSQSRLGPRSVVNAFTADFPASHTTPSGESTIAGRLQVATADIDPAQNPNALYFVEGHYIAADDHAAGNAMNNAAYRQIWVGNGFSISFLPSGGDPPSATIRSAPGIYAWKEYDPAVAIAGVDIPGDGRIYVGWNASRIDADTWHYEIAIQNFNSHRSVQSVTVNLPAGHDAAALGFADVDYHSGEPYSATDWPGVIAAQTVSWATDSYATNQNANALRWGTLYNFWFNADVPPDMIGMVDLGLFRPGSPEAVAVELPALNMFDDCDRPKTVTSGVHAFDTTDASTDGPAEACGFGGVTDYDVWYRYLPTCSGTATFSTCGSSFNTVLAVYGGQCPASAGAALACNDDACGEQSTVTLGVTAGVPVLVRVGGVGGARGVGQLTISCADAPGVANDECAAAIPVANGLTYFSTSGATSSTPSDSSGTCSSSGWGSGSHADVWFSYVATCSGPAIFKTCQSSVVSYDTKIAVYNGCPTGNNQALACNGNFCDSRSYVIVNVTAGATYLVRVGGNNGASGWGVLTIECTGTPALCGNDTQATATVIGSLPYTASGDTRYCTNNYDEVCPYANSESPDAVFSYTPAQDTMVDVALCASGYDTKVYVYQGFIAPGASIACDDDGCGTDTFRSVLSDVQMLGGQTYYIVVDGWNGAAGPYTLDLTSGPALTAGDLNCDGVVNFGDIDPFVLALSGQAAYQAAYPGCEWLLGDFDENGVVNFADIDPFVAALSGL